MRLAAMALVGLIGLFAALLGAAGLAHADAPPQSDEPSAERWSADPRLWLALIEWRQRLRFELASSRELCTAGTLTEISWQISGGKPPYALQVEGTSVNVDADNIRINCGALSEAEAADEDAALAAKRISAVVTDARGVRQEAALDVARARALPAPEPRGTAVQRTRMATNWVTIGGAHHEADVGWWLMRWRSLAESDSGWTYVLVEKRRVGNIEIAGFDGLSEGSSYAYAVATLRAPIEQETPDALVWSSESEATTSTTPTGVRATSTHDTITVTWDDQPSVNRVAVDLIRADGAGRSRRVTIRRRDAVVTNQVTHIDLEPKTEYEIDVSVHGDGEAQLLTTIRATTVAAPTDWQPPARGAQNLSVTATHDTITATWDAPTPNTRDRWIVYVEHSSWRRPYSRWVSAPLTFTLEGLTPETTYTVTVAHLDLYGVEVSTTVTTTPAPVQGQSSPGYPADPRLWLALIEWRQRLRLELASSRELCTAGTLTEISWQIAGGKPPYKLQVEGTPVNADADNVRINCGALTEAEAADEDAALAAKQISAAVTDARGVRREAALDVARARALPPPGAAMSAWPSSADAMSFSWPDARGAEPCDGLAPFAVRWRRTGASDWNYARARSEFRGSCDVWKAIGDLQEGAAYEAALAALRVPIELETPNALRWTEAAEATTITTPSGVTASATHDTVTVRWNRQPSARRYRIFLYRADGGAVGDLSDYDSAAWGDAAAGMHEFVFNHLPAATEYKVMVMIPTPVEHPRLLYAQTEVRTAAAPPGVQALPRGPQNLRATATADGITVRWDAPFVGAASEYKVTVYHPRYPQKPLIDWVYQTEFSQSGLESGVTYQVHVEHTGVVSASAQIAISTTAPVTTDGASGTTTIDVTPPSP